MAYNTFLSNAAQGGTGAPAGGGFGGSIATTSGIPVLNSCILAKAVSSSNCFGVVTDGGHNLCSDGSCSFSNAGSLNNVDCKLGPLGDFGGSAPTVPLMVGSPAIDAGDALVCPATDQRGRNRPYGSGCDIGAFESSPPYAMVGQVSGPHFVDEVMVSAGAAVMATTNGGAFILQGLTAGTFLLGAHHSNYVFKPTDYSVTVGPDQFGLNFKAYRWNTLAVEDHSNDIAHLIYAGTNGLSYRLMASTNLIDWFATATNTIGPDNLFEYFETGMSNDRSRYFQIVHP